MASPNISAVSFPVGRPPTEIISCAGAEVSPLAEYRICRSLNGHEIERLITLGVTASAIGGSYSEGEFCLAADEVVFLDCERFEFARYAKGGEAVNACIFLCRDQLGEIADLVAGRGEFLASWLGRVSMLGEHNALAPRLGHGLTVHETPMDWLKAGRDGVVIADGERAKPILHCAGPLLVQSVRYGKNLGTKLMTPSPRIRVKAAA
jgi:hypothetical protein